MFVALEFTFAKAFEEFFNETFTPLLMSDIYQKKEYEMEVSLVFSEVYLDMLMLRPF